MSESAMPVGRILIVDDDDKLAQTISEALERIGHECSTVNSAREGLEVAGRFRAEVVLVDLVLPDSDGITLLERMRNTLPSAEFIVITGHATVGTAVEAMEKGAFTYMEKPVKVKELRLRVGRALERARLRSRNRRLEQENIDLARQVTERYGFEAIIGNSPRMRHIVERLKVVSGADVSVLIHGESGTGKELVARTIHNNSPRRDRPFVPLHCAALSEGILESELFGHEKGAFTGAVAARAGRFEFADGGTLFLDEVSDMPIPTQVKLLRVLEDGEVQRLGSNKVVKTDVRVLAAADRDLNEEVQAGRFRAALYFRLKVVTIELPPLRERLEDVPLLLNASLDEFKKKHSKPVDGIEPDAMAILSNYRWPGNVRELRNTVESMVVVAGSRVLRVADIPENIRSAAAALAPTTAGASGEHLPAVMRPETSLPVMSMQEAEKRLIRSTLEMTGGNRKKAAEILKIGERTLYRKLKDYGLQ